MSNTTILAIDDSATIRKLVDACLSSAGFRVVLASDAAAGLRLAYDHRPDLILLDHQLPGTTGYEVCRELSESPELRDIPVVISSTLRKKAYAAYIDLDNVVDMLPKPYTEDLLITTISNALETATMVVDCQTRGTSAPEVLHPLEDEALTGSFSFFGLREVIDFLNNGRQAGVLEIEIDALRIRLHLDRGRIQGVDALGVDAAITSLLMSCLPSSLASLGPILKLTVGGRSCAELDGFVQLLDQKVLDPRLMSRLLRYQAAMLLRFAFARKLKQFRFSPRPAAHGLHKNLPLDISLLALLVEGALHDAVAESPADTALYARRAIRGQNLDRTGLSPQHLKLLNFLTEPQDARQLAAALGWELAEVHRVLDAFIMAELVEVRAPIGDRQFVVYEPSATAAKSLRTSLDAAAVAHGGQVVRDRLALQLVLKHSIPQTFFFAGDDDEACKLIRQLFATKHAEVAKVKRVAIVGSALQARDVNWQEKVGFQPDSVISRPCTAERVFAAIDSLRSAPRPEADASPQAASTGVLAATIHRDLSGSFAGVSP